VTPTDDDDWGVKVEDFDDEDNTPAPLVHRGVLNPSHFSLLMPNHLNRNPRPDKPPLL
jgi:hypothetical protein